MIYGHSLRHFSLFLLVVFTLPEGASHGCGPGEFGCKWTSTLNFSDEKASIKTGKSGTVRSMRTKEEGFLHIEGGKPFDFDDLHKKLSESERIISENLISDLKSSNVVVGGFTLIVQEREGVYAFFQPFDYMFMSGASYKNKNHLDKTRKKSKEEHQKLSEIPFLKKRLRKVHNYRISEVDESFRERFDLVEGSYSVNKAHPNYERRVAIRNNVSQFYNAWRIKREEGRKEVRKELQKLAKMTLPPPDEEFEVEITKSAESLIETYSQGVTNNYWSIADSEQFLLHYLQTDRHTPQFLLSCRDAYEEQRKVYYRQELLDSAENSDIDAVEELMTKYFKQDQTPATRGRRILGAVLSVHSTNEFYCCCAASMFEYSQVAPVSEKLKTLNGGRAILEGELPPFFRVMTSSGRLLDQKLSDVIDDGANITPTPGILSKDDGNFVDCGEEAMKDNLFLPQRFVPQLLLEET